jgi:hypothetical protein
MCLKLAPDLRDLLADSSPDGMKENAAIPLPLNNRRFRVAI